MLGIEVASEEVVPGNFQDATSQLLNMQKNNTDYAYINVTTTGASIILKDAQKLGLKIKFGSNPFGFSEKLPEVARATAEGRDRRDAACSLWHRCAGNESDSRIQ